MPARQKLSSRKDVTSSSGEKSNPRSGGQNKSNLGGPARKRLTPRERLNLLKRVYKEKVSVSKACQEFGVSRFTFYELSKRYVREASDEANLKLLAVRFRRKKAHYRSLSPELQKQILKFVYKNPKLSSHKLAASLPGIGNHGVQLLLEKVGLNTKESRKKISALSQEEFRRFLRKKNVAIRQYFSPEDKLAIIQRVVKNKEKAAKVCQEAGISRFTFYRWLKLYEQDPGLERLSNRWVSGKLHYRAIPEALESRIIKEVVINPHLSSHKLAQRIVGIGNHGVQRILERENLSRYELRLAYSQAHREVPQVAIPKFSDRVRYIFEQFIPSLAPAPPPFDSLHSLRPSALRLRLKETFGPRFIKPFFTSLLLVSLFSYGALSWIRIISQATSLSSVLGLVFASMALVTGSFFFLYSFKYYITLALVLSFSQQEAGIQDTRYRGQGRVRVFLSWLLGLNGHRPATGPGGKPQGPEGEEAKRAVGLTPNLEHIKLKRYPKVAIHIPFYNEKNVVERAMAASTNFDYQGEYEVVLCDDSTDETTQIIEKYLKVNSSSTSTRENKEEGWKLTSGEIRPGVVLKHLHRTSRSGFKGGALRLALSVCDPRAEFVSVFDADFVPYPDTLELFLKYFQATAGTLDFGMRNKELGIKNKASENPNSSFVLPDSHRIAAVQGYQWHVLNKSENWITRGIRSEYAGSYVIERSGTEIYGGLKMISGAVYMIRRDVLEEVGWETSITEDFQLTLKLYEKGYKVVFTPYIQAPAECVSTLKRLIRQRMRWAEGHSNNIRRMFFRLLLGKWETVGGSSGSQFLSSNYSNYSKQSPSTKSQLGQLGIRSIRNSGGKQKIFVPSPLTLSEKLEFLYLCPYYLQAFFFLVGTISWLVSEILFPARLPFWTSLWGWSLVLTNMLSLPLMNTVGLFLEESEEKDYGGLPSFIALSYIVVPFQAYAALKGFLEKEEGHWFRTPKTGRITDILKRGTFYRFISGILPGRSPSPNLAHTQVVNRKLSIVNRFTSYELPFTSKYLALATAKNRLNLSDIRKRKERRKIGRIVLVSLLISALLLNYVSFFTPQTVQAQGSDPKIEQQINIIDQQASLNWYNTSWGKRQPVTITNNTASVLTDFQIRLTVSHDSDMQTDFEDLRFTNSSETLLDFWLEYYIDSDEAKVWVEVDFLPASSSTTIYMYYDNSGASSGSSRNNTFDTSLLGTFSQSFSDSNIAPNHGASSDRDSNFYISQSAYVNRFNTSWTYLQQYGSLDIYTGLCYDDINDRFYGIDWTNKQWSTFTTGFVETSPQDQTLGDEPIDCATDSTYVYTNHRNGKICRNKISDNTKECIDMDTLSGFDWGGQGLTWAYGYLFAGTSGSFGANGNRIYVIDIDNWSSPSIVTYWDASGHTLADVAGLTWKDKYIYQTSRNEDNVSEWQGPVKTASTEPSSTFDSESEQALSNYLPEDNSLGIIEFDPTKYDGETVYFEVVRSVDGSTWTRSRSSSLSMPVTAKEFTVKMRVGDGSSNTPGAQLYNKTDSSSTSTVTFGSTSDTDVYLKAARLIIVQTNTVPPGITDTQTQIEVGNNETTTNTSYTQLTDKKIYRYTSSAFTPSPSTYFETSLKAGIPTEDIGFEQQINITTQDDYTTNSTSFIPSDNSLGLVHWEGSKYDGDTVYFEAVIYDTGNHAEAALYTEGGSQIAIASTTGLGDYATYRVRSTAISLTDGTSYTVRFRSSDSGRWQTLNAARLIIVQSDPGKIEDTRTVIEVGNAEKQDSSTATQLTDKKIYYYDSSQFSPAPTASFSATLRNSPPTIEQQINIIDQEYTTDSLTFVPTDNSLGLVRWDADKYSGTVSVYLDAAVYKAGNIVYVGLFSEAGAEITSISPPSGGDFQTHKIRSSALTLTDDTNYTVRLKSSTAGKYQILRAARLVVVQTDATKITDTGTHIEVGDEETGFTNTSYSTLTDYKIYQYDQDEFSPNPETSPGDVEFHASLKVDDSGDTVYAALYNMTTDPDALVAEVSHTGDTDWTLKIGTNVDGDSDWDTSSDDEYIVYVRCNDDNGGGCSGNIANAKIVLDQSATGGITDVELIHGQINTLETDTDDSYTSQDRHNRFNPDLEGTEGGPSLRGGVFTYYFESTLKTSTATTTTAYAQLNNRTDSSAITSSEVTTTNDSYTRVRSGDVSSNLPQYPAVRAKNLDTNLKNSEASGDTTSASSSWLIIQVSSLATSGVTAYADLYNLTNSTQVSNSEISTTSEDWTWVTSGTITLTTDKEYVVRLKSSNNNVDIHMVNAKLTLDQSDGTNGVTKVEIIHQQVNTKVADSDTGYTDQEYMTRYDPDSFSGGSFVFYFEATISTSGGTGYAKLKDDSASDEIDDPTTSEVIETGSSYDRERSLNLASNTDWPSSAVNLDTIIKNSASNTTSVSSSWLIIEASNLGSVIVSAALYEDGSSCTTQVSGSELSTTSTSWTRVRTASTISLSNATDYMVCVKTNKDISNIANAKIIHNQSDAGGITHTEFVHQYVNTRIVTWYDTDWVKRQPVTITNNTGSTLTNYQVEITVSHDSDMQGDFEDLRFANSSGDLLYHWTETYTASTTATVWVEVDSIPASDSTTIYMYYNNGSVGDGSDGDNTFLFFDDFPGSGLDGSKWDIINSGTGSESVSSGILSITSTGDWWGTSDTSRILLSKTSVSSDYAAEARVTDSGSANYNRFYGLRASSATNSRMVVMLLDDNQSHLSTVYRTSDGGSSTYQGNDIASFSDPHIAKWTRETSTLRGYTDSTLINTISSISGLNYVALTSTGGGTSKFDWIYVRELASTEPSSTFGSEEFYTVADDIDNLFDPDNFDAGTFTYYFESTFKVSSGTGYARLYNQSDTTQIDERSTTSTSYTRERSGSLSMPSAAKTLDTRLANSGAASSWLIIAVSNLQIPENLLLILPLVLYIPKIFAKKGFNIPALNFGLSNQVRLERRRKRLSTIYRKEMIDDG